MSNEIFINFCTKQICDIYNANYDDELEQRECFIVWFSKTLQNRKVLISTEKRDGMYYECTLNGDKNEIYIDIYEKQHNIKYIL